MAENPNKTNWGQTIVASVGIISVCAVSIILKQPSVLLCLAGVFFVVAWID